MRDDPVMLRPDNVRFPKNRVVASECDLYGHDYQVRDVEFEEGEAARPRVPDRVFCGRCGKSWKVER